MHLNFPPFAENIPGAGDFSAISDVTGWLFCGSVRVRLTEVRVGSGRDEKMWIIELKLRVQTQNFPKIL